MSQGFVVPGDPQSEKVAQIGADIVEGDLASNADVRSAAKGAEAIFHLGAAFQAGGPFTPEQYFDINVKGTFNILEAALASDRIQHVIHTSTDGTMEKYPPEGIEEPIREDSLPLAATAWYGYTKVLTEHLVDRYVRAESLAGDGVSVCQRLGSGRSFGLRAVPLADIHGAATRFGGRRRSTCREAYELMSKAYEGEPHFIHRRRP